MRVDVVEVENMYSLSHNQVLVIWWATLISAALSLFGSSFMLITIFMFGKRKGLSRLIIFLALGDWAWSLSVCVGHIILLTNSENYKNVCVFFRILFQFFGGSTVFWTTCIAFYLYKCVFSVTNIKNNSPQNGEIIEDKIIFTIFHVISWGVPSIFCITLVISDNVIQDNDLKLCFPKPYPHFFMWFLPIIICFVSSVIVYILLMYKLKTTMSWRFILQGYKDQTLSLPFRIALYLLVFLACWGVDIAQYGAVSVHNKQDSSEEFSTPLFSVVVIYNIMLQSQGLLDFMVYGVANKEARKNYSGRTAFTIAVFLLSPILVIPCMIAPFREYCCGDRRKLKYRSLENPTV